MHRFYSIAALSILVAVPLSHAEDKLTITADDLRPLVQSDWVGSLTYMNYQPPYQDVTIPAALEVFRQAAGLDFHFKYPDEPHANSHYTFTHSEVDGTLDGNPIILRETTEDGTLKVVTGYPCEDMGRAADCTTTFTLSHTEFSQTKYVTYTDTGERIRRNAYSYTR